jgi:hypothetical protein
MTTTKDDYSQLRDGIDKNPPRGTKAINFLRRFRPEGPWVITTIIPDGHTCTRTFTDLEEARRFIAHRNDAEEGVYYTVNLTIDLMQSKPRKADIAEIEYLHLDADPEPNETPERFKARLLPLLEQAEPTFIIDSGNGLHGLWRLERPVKADSPDVIADIEARNLALAEKFGAKAGTQNIDRILRMPGTWNWPNEKKRRDGRSKCWAKLIRYDDVAHPFSAFPPKKRASEKSTDRRQATPNELPKGIRALLHLEADAGYETRSGLLMAFLMKCVRAHIAERDIITACLDPAFEGKAIYEHCREQKEPEAYIKRQISRARDKVGTSGSAGDDETRLLVRRCINQFERRNLEWIWEPFIPSSLLTLLMGDKAVGKSSVAIDMAARISTGRAWPRFGHDPEVRAPKGSVIILCKENDISRIIRPRLEAAKADISRVYTVGYKVPDDPEQIDPLERLDTTVKDLEQQIREIGDVKLIVIDPITDYAGKIDMYRDSAVRGLLNPLGRLASRHDLAIVMILHLNKKPDLPARYRGLGGVGIRNVSQSTIMVGLNADFPGERFMAQDAANLCAETRSVSFQMVNVGLYHRIEWGSHWEEADLDERMADKRESKQDRAQQLLRQWLARGPVEVDELKSRTEREGIGWRTMKKAKKDYGAKSVRMSPARDAPYYWAKPGDEEEPRSRWRPEFGGDEARNDEENDD